MAHDALKLVVVGHVDHGKSTLVGRLLHDSSALPSGKVEQLRAAATRRGVEFEWAFLLDALQAERNQGITIDTTQIRFRTARREVVLIDAPGHKEFLKNMVTGAAQADAALLVVDAADGVKEQSRRHGYMLHLLGVRQVAVVVNKMDMVNFGEAPFGAIMREIGGYLASIGVVPSHAIPVSARAGDNLAQPSARTPWYSGPTVVAALEDFTPLQAPVDLPLRLPIQDVYKFDHRRILVGRIESGRLAVGDTLLFSPENRSARVASLEAWPEAAAPRLASAGDSVGITLDEPLFIERGSLASHLVHPPVETDVFRARLFWLGRSALTQGATYKLKLATAEAAVVVQSIDKVIDADTLAERDGGAVERDAVAEVTLRARRVLALDDHAGLARTGRFVLVDGHDIAGGGIVSMEGYADQRRMAVRPAANIYPVERRVSRVERERRNGHRGGVIWLTGLSGAGKSTLAGELERRLFQRGYQAFVLDGDNLRGGLNADLGFGPEDRAENIRRAGELAALLAEAGIIVVTAFISPYRSDRDRARAAARSSFHEIHVAADLAVCERRDPKGLYRRARRGEIKEFTGVSAPYEPPEAPDLIVRTDEESIETCVDRLERYVRAHLSDAEIDPNAEIVAAGESLDAGTGATHRSPR